MNGKIGIFVILGAVILLTGSLTAGDPRVTDGLIVYYSFDDPEFYNNRQVPDDSGYGHTATVKGDVFYDNTDPKRGSGAAKFMGFASSSYTQSGYPSYLDLHGRTFPPRDMPTSALTVSVWVKCDPVATTHPSESNKHEHCFINIIPTNWEAMIQGARRYSFFRFNLAYGPEVDEEICDFRYVGGNPGIELTSWYWLHLTGVYDRATEKAIVYYNGKPWWVMTPDTNPTLIPENFATDWSGGAFIGTHVYAHPLWNRTFHGYMDEFYMFKRALTEKEIQILAADQETVGDYIETDGYTLVVEPVSGLYQDSFDIVLNSQPTSDVYVAASTGGSSDFTIVGSPTKTFNSGNWNTPQVFTIQATNDGSVEDKVEVGYVSFSITGDSGFAGKFIPDVKVFILDNDQRIVNTFSPLNPTVGEDGTTDTYEVFLSYPPAGSYTVTVTPSYDPCEVTITPASLTFNSSNYGTPQSFTVQAVDDEEPDKPNSSHTTTINHVITSSDSNYNALPTDSVLVVIMDNECGAWKYSPADFDNNCTVDLYDFAQLASYYLECTAPNSVGCQRNNSNP